MRHQRVRNYLLGIVLCAFISAGGLSVSAQTPTPSPSPTPQTSSTSTLEHDFFKNILRDQKAIWTAPFHLHGDDAYWLAPITLGTAAFIVTDRDSADEMAESHNQASRIISYLGTGYATGGIAATFYAVGRATHNQRARETGVLRTDLRAQSASLVSPGTTIFFQMCWLAARWVMELGVTSTRPTTSRHPPSEVKRKKKNNLSIIHDVGHR